MEQVVNRGSRCEIVLQGSKTLLTSFFTLKKVLLPFTHAFDSSKNCRDLDLSKLHYLSIQNLVYTLVCLCTNALQKQNFGPVSAKTMNSIAYILLRIFS